MSNIRLRFPLFSTLYSVVSGAREEEDGDAKEEGGGLVGSCRFHKTQIPPENPTTSTLTKRSKPRVLMIALVFSPLTLVSERMTKSGWCELQRSLKALLKSALADRLSLD